MVSTTAEIRPQLLAALAQRGIAASDVLGWTLQQRHAETLAQRHGEVAVLPVALADETCWVLVRQLA